MAARAWYSLRWRSWCTWFSVNLRRFTDRSTAVLACWLKLVRWGFILGLALGAFFTAAIVWRALLMVSAPMQKSP